MTYFLLFLGIILFLVALMFLFRLFMIQGTKCQEKKKLQKQKELYKTQKDEFGNTIFVRCPLCNSPLEKTGKMFSKIFRPMKNGDDQLMTVQGCNRCFPVCSEPLKRTCPVCRKILSEEDFLRARLFNRGNGKKHVLVTGCNKCSGR